MEELLNLRVDRSSTEYALFEIASEGGDHLLFDGLAYDVSDKWSAYEESEPVGNRLELALVHLLND